MKLKAETCFFNALSGLLTHFFFNIIISYTDTNPQIGRKYLHSCLYFFNSIIKQSGCENVY